MDGVSDEHGNRVPCWGDDDDPALHAIRAGGSNNMINKTIWYTVFLRKF